MVIDFVNDRERTEKPKKVRKETGNYIFGKTIAKAMKSIGQRTQMEAAMMSMFTIILGLIFMTIYIPFFTDFPLLMKIGTVVNTLAGMGFIGSYLITSFQQYQSYMMVMGIIKDEQNYN